MVEVGQTDPRLSFGLCFVSTGTKSRLQAHQAVLAAVSVQGSKVAVIRRDLEPKVISLAARKYSESPGRQRHPDCVIQVVLEKENSDFLDFKLVKKSNSLIF